MKNWFKALGLLALCYVALGSVVTVGVWIVVEFPEFWIPGVVLWVNFLLLRALKRQVDGWRKE